MAYDPTHDYVVMFGGQGSEGRFLRDTWAYSSTGWQSLSPGTLTASNSPSGRVGAAAAYDPSLGGIVLFGGKNLSGPLQDTWLLKNGVWTNLTGQVGQAPPARVSPALVYDPVDGYLVLYGGRTPSAILNDTWTFNGVGWSDVTPNQINATNSPPHRYQASMTFDMADGYVLLFGGYSTTNLQPLALNDSWRFVAGTWTRISTPTSPSARAGAAMSYDPTQSEVVLFGGTNNSSSELNDTWTFSSGVWTSTADTSPLAPSARTLPAMAASFGTLPTSRFLVLFGGQGGNGAPLNDTWIAGTLPVEEFPLRRSNAFTDVGQPLTLTATPYGGVLPYTFSWTSLPVGCVSSNVSALTCVPSQAGTSEPSVTVVGAQSSGSASASANVTVNPDPAISEFSVTPSTYVIGGNGILFSVKDSGGTGTLSFSYTGLPPGCISNNTPQLTCLPSKTGTFTVEVNATDHVGYSVYSNVTFSVTGTPGTLKSLLDKLSNPAVIAGIAVGIILLALVVVYFVRSRRASRARGPVAPSAPGARAGANPPKGGPGPATPGPATRPPSGKSGSGDDELL
jgi:hypothetical protein